MRNVAVANREVVDETAEGRELLSRWLGKLRRLHRGHWTTAKKLDRRRMMLGMPATILSIAVGTSLFATLESTDTTWRIVAGIISMIAAILVGLQTFMNYAERAQQHRLAGSQFGEMRRSAEIAVAFPPADDDEMAVYMRELKTQWCDVDQNAPAVPSGIYERTSTEE